MQNGSPGVRYLPTCISLPPVMVSSPVSTRVTFQGSLRQSWYSTRFASMSKVTSAWCRKEFANPELGVQLHDVPENGPRPDLDHGLRPGIRLLGDAGALAAGENHALHERAPTS